MRNRWAHGAGAPPSGDLYRDADTAVRLLRLIGAPTDTIDSIEALRLRALQAISRENELNVAPPRDFPGITSAPALTKKRSAKGKTLQIGRINENGQELIRGTNLPGNHANQKLYVMRCTEPACGHEYGANGADVWLRKCPRCQGGKPGLSFA